MKKDVLVTVTGFQFEDRGDRAEPIAVTVPGTYYFKNGRHYLIYEERMGELPEPTRNMVRFSQDQVEVRRKGLITTDLVFARNRHSASIYQTPLGDIGAEITATRIDLEEEEDRIDVDIEYALTLDGQRAQDCQVSIHVEPRLGNEPV